MEDNIFIRGHSIFFLIKQDVYAKYFILKGVFGGTMLRRNRKIKLRKNICYAKISIEIKKYFF